MDAKIRNILSKYETDVDGAIKRFSGDEDLYIYCLTEFLHDETMIDLASALETKSWDDAFTAAHAIKGLAGNMGFVPLFHAAARVVVLIRAGRIDDIDGPYSEMLQCYNNIIGAIQLACSPSPDLDLDLDPDPDQD